MLSTIGEACISLDLVSSGRPRRPVFCSEYRIAIEGEKDNVLENEIALGVWPGLVAHSHYLCYNEQRTQQERDESFVQARSDV